MRPALLLLLVAALTSPGLGLPASPVQHGQSELRQIMVDILCQLGLKFAEDDTEARNSRQLESTGKLFFLWDLCIKLF